MVNKFHILGYVGIAVFLLIGVVVATGYVIGEINSSETNSTELLPTYEKVYDELTSTAIIIDNESKEEIAEVKLITPQRRIAIPGDYVFEYEIDLTKEQVYDLLANTEIFYKDSMEKITNNSLSLKYYDPVGTYPEIVYDYIDTCDGIWKDNKTECIVLKGTHIEDITGSWLDFNKANPLPIGKTKIRGYYPNMEEGVLYEWIPTFFDVKVEEWATFGAATIREYQLTHNTQSTNYDPYWEATTFTIGTVGPNEDFTLKGVSLWLFKGGLPTNTVYFKIRATTGGTPSGADISTGSIDPATLTTSAVLTNLTMSDVTLEAGKTYVLIEDPGAGSTSSKSIKWYLQTGAGSYAGGSRWYSSNDGAGWNQVAAQDYRFQIWGETAGAATCYVYDSRLLYVPTGCVYYNPGGEFYV